MPGAPHDTGAAQVGFIGEQELAASSLGLLGLHGLWASLRLPLASQVDPSREPWLAYWTTLLAPATEVLQARARLARALAAFEQHGDRVGELLCLAAIIEGFYVEEGALEPLDDWIDALARRLPLAGQWPSEELEARVMGCGVAVRLRQPAHPMLIQWAERGATLVRQLRPGPGRIKLASFLAQHHFWRGEFARCELIIDALPGLQVDGLQPAEALVWLATLANHANYAARFQRGQQAIEAALALVQQHGLRQHEYAWRAMGASMALSAHDQAQAARHLEAMRPLLQPGRQADQTHYWHYLAGLALLQGQPVQAVELARQALDNSGEIGGPYRLATHRISLGQALLCSGRPAEALAALEAALAAAQGIDAALLVFTARLSRAVALLRLGQVHEASDTLHAAWTDGAQRDFRGTAVWWLPEVVGEAATEALRQDIAPGFVRRFVRLRGVPGSDPACADWPWPLVLRAFGRFEVVCNEQPLTRLSGKTAQRPLDLLRALLANGATPLPVATAMQWLWPEADPAAQRKAFDVALLRLRRLLDDPRLLHLEGGRLRLDPQWCYSDVHALQTLMARIDLNDQAGLSHWLGQARQLLALVRGPFLEGEDDDWVRGARERLRRRFVVVVSQLGGRIEPLEPTLAIDLYERALDVEPLAETLSRRLMRLHADRGDLAEALRVWRACRTLLAVAEGLEPARETRALAEELGLPAR
jgi:DNA-binding SARP family transcriptional activator